MMRHWSRLAVAALLVAAAACASGPRPERKDGPLHHYNLARLHFEQGRTADAIREIDRALAMDGSLAQAHFYRGYIQWNLEHWADAEKSFRLALERNAYYTDARAYLATCLDQQGRPDEALAELDRAAQDKTYPTPEKIGLNKALILHRARRLEDALAELRRVIDVRPRYAPAHYEMAQVFDDLGRSADAIAAYQVAGPSFAQDPQYHLRYGRALFRGGRELEARRELQRAIELAPGSTVAGEAQQLLGVIG